VTKNIIHIHINTTPGVEKDSGLMWAFSVFLTCSQCVSNTTPGVEKDSGLVVSCWMSAQTEATLSFLFSFFLYLFARKIVECRHCVWWCDTMCDDVTLRVMMWHIVSDVSCWMSTQTGATLSFRFFLYFLARKIVGCWMSTQTEASFFSFLVSFVCVCVNFCP